MAAETRGLHIITQAESFDNYAQLRSSETSIAFASLMAEQVDILCEEDERNAKVFDLLVSAFSLIKDGADQLRSLLVFELHLLQTQGYRPEVYSCISCGSRLSTGGANGFSIDGGVVCHRCLQSNYSAKSISDNAIKLARLIDEGQIGRALSLKTSIDTLYELDAALAVYISHISGKYSRARSVLDTLQIRTGSAN
jgi:DNA repair protein RecO (recombination protein O)